VSEYVSGSKFDALRNAIYHTARRDYYDCCNRLLNFAVIVLGAGVATKAAGMIHVTGIVLELSVLVTATAQLTFDFGFKARTHEFLQKRYFEMLEQMELDDDIDQKKWTAKLYSIASEEPMPMRALDALAYNAALDATTSDIKIREANRVHIPLRHRILCNFVAFNAYQYRLESEHLSLWHRLVKRCGGHRG
jgi:hypothetical protein